MTTRFAGELVLRTPTIDDGHEIRNLMRSTIVLGRPALGVDLDDYLDTCLHWYLADGLGDSAVCRIDGAFRGYALVGLDPLSAERAHRRAALRLSARVLRRSFLGQIDPATRRFYLLRLRDAVGLTADSRQRLAVPHAHMNITTSARSGSVALALRDHIDQKVNQAGFDRWLGEVNARSGSRASALERLGFSVIGTRKNHTLSALAGSPVERLLVERRLA